MDRLRLEDMSDREVLLVIHDLVGKGFVDPEDVADKIGLKGKHARRAASMRLAWLRRMGTLDREHLTNEHGNIVTKRTTGEPRFTQRYALTDLGLSLANGDLRAGQQKALGTLNQGQMLTLTRMLNEQAVRSGGEVQRLVKREWRYRTEFVR
jgi:hypothetical protein